MAITLVELRQRLAAKFNEVEILELLDLRSEDIVEAFADRIEEKQDLLTKELEGDDEFNHQDYQEAETT